VRELSIDIETYSEEKIETGVHKYVEHNSFEILLIAYRFDDETPQLIDLAMGDEMHYKFYEWLTDPSIVKCAYNAAFERICFEKYFGKKLNIDQWKCTMALAAQAGYPFGLDMVAKVMRTTEQKDSKGKELIKYFCEPCKPTKTNKQRTRNYYNHDFNKWLDFRGYCVQDVLTEYNIRKRLEWLPICDFEKPVYALDQKINDRGVKVDTQLSENAISMNDIFVEEVSNEIRIKTGIEKPTSVVQIKKYIFDQTGETIDSLSKEAMPEIFKMFQGNDHITQLLKARQQITRTSIKKFHSILSSVCADSRVKGLFQYYGANRTGRFAGRRVQLHNLKRNSLDDLSLARQLLLENKKDAISLIYGDVGYVLSNLIRTTFIADKGKTLIVSDFAAIEARITAWFADEMWRIKIFQSHGRIYEASASQMFGVDIDSITYEENGKVKKGPNYEMRSKGKVAELALGYQGSLGALQRMGGADMGLSDDEMKRIVKLWRKASPKIVRLWYDVQECAIRAIRGEVCKLPHGLKFWKANNNLMIQLPSGRNLVYINARVYINDFGSEGIKYEGLDQETGKWSIQESYGGKLVENIVQATARDVLVDSMKRLDEQGYDIIMHVHDEVVLESDEATSKEVAEIVTKILKQDIPWAKGLPLGAETFTSKFYKK
jgi:DNA polymerase